MKLNNMMSIYAAITAIFGAILFLAPAVLISMYGANLDAQAEVLYRFIGGIFIGLAAMTWLGREADASKSRDSMVLGLTVINAISAIVAIMAAFYGVYNSLAWMQAVLYALFAVGFYMVGKASMSRTAA